MFSFFKNIYDNVVEVFTPDPKPKRKETKSEAKERKEFEQFVKQEFEDLKRSDIEADIDLEFLEETEVFIAKSKIAKDKDVILHKLHYTLDSPLHVRDHRDFLNVEAAISKVYTEVAANHVLRNTKVQIVLITETSDGRPYRIVSTSFTEFKDSKQGPTSRASKFLIKKLVRDIGSYDTPHFVIVGVDLNYIDLPPIVVGGSVSRTIQSANKKWLMVSPKTKNNCFYHAVIINRFWEKKEGLKVLSEDEYPTKKVVDSSKALKQCLKLRMRKKGITLDPNRFADENIFQEMASYTGLKIATYNNIYKLLHIYEPILDDFNGRAIKRGLNKPFIEIGFSDNHAVALIDKKRILKQYPDFQFDVPTEVKEAKTELKYTKLKRKYKNAKKNTKIAAWDIETTLDDEKNHVPYACSIAWYEEKELKEQQFWGLDCLENFSEFLYENIATFKKYTLYAHNGGKFDLPLALDRAFIDSEHFDIVDGSAIEINNAFIGMSMQVKGTKTKIHFRDSLRMLPGSLKKLCEDFNVTHKKLTETVSHDDVTLDNYMNFPEMKLYLTHDVFGLLEVMTEFSNKVYDEMSIDVTKCFTGASLAKKNFFIHFYKPWEYDIHTLTAEQDKMIRSGYYGGRVEVFKLGETHGSIYYYDFTSLYPATGTKDLPYGEPRHHVYEEGANKHHMDDFFGFVRCKVKTIDKKALPLHCMYKDSRLIFPIFEEWTELVIFTPELNYDIYDYIFIEGWRFEKGPVMKKFFEKGFLKKATAKKNGQTARAQAQKIIINSGYGFWGLRTKERDGIEILKKGDNRFQMLMAQNKVTNIRVTKKYLVLRTLKDLDIKDFNVSIAAAISSYARVRLWEFITAIRNAGGEAYYGDTDSVICNINLNDYPEIQREFQPDLTGETLGSIKNEADEIVGKHIKKKIKQKYPGHETDLKQRDALNEDVQSRLDDIRARYNGNIPFDKLIVNGCKAYSLQMNIEILGEMTTLEINKLKGWSNLGQSNKLDYKMARSLNTDGNTISQDQLQFRCPKANYVSETESFKIKSLTVTKSFRQIYTKGNIEEGGAITPLIL